MLQRPSDRRRNYGRKPPLDLPLVPILDAFVVLIAFLLIATSLLAVTLIDTPVPITSTLPPDKSRPLALTIRIKQDHYRIESGFNRIKAVKIPRIDDTDMVKIHDALIGIKQKFPKEKQLVLMPDSDIEYEMIIKVIDASSRFGEGDPSIYTKDAEGTDVVITDLFPDIVFGNVTDG